MQQRLMLCRTVQDSVTDNVILSNAVFNSIAEVDSLLREALVSIIEYGDAT